MTTSEISSTNERSLELQLLIAERAAEVVDHVAEANGHLWRERGLLFAASFQTGKAQKAALKENGQRIVQAHKANEVVLRFMGSYFLSKEDSADGVSGD